MRYQDFFHFFEQFLQVGLYSSNLLQPIHENNDVNKKKALHFLIFVQTLQLNLDIHIFGSISTFLDHQFEGHL